MRGICRAALGVWAARAMCRCGPMLVAVTVLVAACGGDEPGREDGQRVTRSPTPHKPAPRAPRAPKPKRAPPAPPAWRPSAGEDYPDGKRLAAAVAEQVTTYPRDSTPEGVARALGAGVTSSAAVTPLVERGAHSEGRTIYPQLSGVTADSLGAMVVVRQTITADGGERRSVDRVVDVRLRLAGDRWALDRVGSVGGTEAERPPGLSPAARRVLADPGIELSDSARWDVYRGGVDEDLLSALADAGRRYDFTITVLRSGHPQHVWATPRPSAHSVGHAADIYEVDGTLVVDQRQAGSPAHGLAATLAARATQLGSPWTFGSRSFTDAVHQDHIHIQQTAVPG